MAISTWNLYSGTNGAESNRSDHLFMKAVATYNPDYSTTVARLSITYTLKKDTDKGFTNPGTRYGILTKGTVVNDSGQITTRGSLLKASSALATITDLSEGGSITKTVTFDFTKGTSAITYSGVTFFINDNNTSTNRSADNTYQWTGEKGSTVSAKPLGFAVISFTVPVGYTNVSNPAADSITFNNSIITPNGSVRVSWSAGSGGNNNPIKEYQVTLNGSTKTTSNTYYDFSNLNLGRGSSYKATVKSIPTISGFGPTAGVESVNQVKGNTLPTAPTVTLTGGTTISGIYYIKSGNSVTFSLSSTDADGHAKTYYQNTTNSINGATAITGTSWSTSTGGTYYFWAKDSLNEYSSATSKSFTVGATLTGSMGDTTSTTTYSNNDTTYTTGGTNAITLTSAGVGTKTYKWSLIYRASNSSTTSTQSLSSTSSSCTWQYQGSNEWGKIYWIKCVVSDQLSQSFTVTSSTYTIPAKPSFNTNIYNQLGTNVSTMPTTNVAGSVTNNFYQTVVTSLTKDTSISLTFSLTPTATVGWYSGASNTTYRNSGVIPLTISGASRDTSYTLRITATAAWGNSFYKDYTIKRAGEPKVQIGATIRNFSSNDITLHGAEVKPFTNIANLNFSFKLGLTGYNFTESALENADAFLFANSIKVRIKEKENSPRQTTDGERYIYTQQGGDSANAGLYNWNTNTLNLNINSATNPVSFRIEFTNVFGEIFYYTKSGLNFNFVETPTVSVTIGSSAGSTEGTILKENNTITYTPNITFYNTDKAVIIRTYIYRSTSMDSQIGGSWELYNGTNPNNGITYTPSRGTSTASAIVYNTPITYTVGEITESKYLHFKISITYGSNTIDSNIPGTYYISQRHKKIDDLSVDVSYENDLFSYTTLLTDRGGGQITTSADDTATGLTEVNYGLQFSQTNDFSTFLWLNSEGALVESSENPDWRTTWVPSQEQRIPPSSYTDSNIDLGSNWDFYNIRPVYYTKIGNVEKTTYGLISTIYGISPTISYRKNQIGVNISNIENRYPEAIIAVGGATDKKYIEFHTVTVNASIDLTTGALDGFIFDGGTWDQS